MGNRTSKKNNYRHRYGYTRTVSPEYEKARIELMNEKAKTYRESRNGGKLVFVWVGCLLAYMVIMLIVKAK